MTEDVRHNPDASRYEVFSGGKLVGIAEYRLRDDRLTLFHTEIDTEQERRGLGSELARAALEDARARGLTVVPTCPFIAWFIATHQEYVDLVVPELRDRVRRSAGPPTDRL